MSTPDKNQSDKNQPDEDEAHKAFKTITFLCTCFILVCVSILLCFHSQWFAMPHFEVIVGLPFAFLLSLFLVLLLKQTEKKIKFSGLSFHFSGVSGEIILWVICFLSIVNAINLLWK